jgi:surface antigen
MKNYPGLIAVTLVCGALLSACKTLPSGDEDHLAAPPLYQRLTDDDVLLADRTVQQALERNLSMNSANWNNPNTGSSGTITPLRTYKNLLGNYCRTYREKLVIGQQQAAYTDTACRSARGNWIPL